MSSKSQPRGREDVEKHREVAVGEEQESGQTATHSQLQPSPGFKEVLQMTLLPAPYRRRLLTLEKSFRIGGSVVK